MAKVALVPMDLRETMLDIGGQEIMTADKVTLRLNAVATYHVADAYKALSAADDARQALYREAQLALRAVIGARELDQFLADKDAVAREKRGTLGEGSPPAEDQDPPRSQDLQPSLFRRQ